MIHSDVFWLLVFGGGALLFISPLFIGMIRDVDGMGLLVFATVLGLVTGIGWVAAMWLAWALPRKLRPASAPQVIRPGAQVSEIPWPFPVNQHERP
jgi:hypothetical protein